MKINQLLKEQGQLSEEQHQFIIDIGLKPYDYSINEDGSLDVNKNLRIDTSDITKFPIKFRNINGDFLCNGGSSNNEGLTTLENGPVKVTGTFDCSKNQLKNLKYGPLEVGKNYNCTWNDIKNLKGVPKKINGYFRCGNNKLSTLNGGPEEVRDEFVCSGNNIKNLKGSPKIVGYYFNVSYNSELTSLDGAHIDINGDFNLVGLSKLTSLKNIHKSFPSITRDIIMKKTGDAEALVIKDGILDLLRIKDLKFVDCDYEPHEEVYKIINKNLGKGRPGILQAQQELIDAGFEDML